LLDEDLESGKDAKSYPSSTEKHSSEEQNFNGNIPLKLKLKDRILKQ
jgi:hypothetical protein